MDSRDTGRQPGYHEYRPRRDIRLLYLYRLRWRSIECAVLGGRGFTVQQGGTYNIFKQKQELRQFVAERDQHRIAVNMSEHNRQADGISHTELLVLLDLLGKPYNDRLISAEKPIADFRSLRIASEIALFAVLADITREMLETALSNKEITLGVIRYPC